MFSSVPVLLQMLTLIGILTAAAAVAYRAWTTESGALKDQRVATLNSILAVSEKKVEYLERENGALKDRIKYLEDQDKVNKSAIISLQDLATKQTATAEIKATLQDFKFIIPMMQQFQAADTDTHAGIKELREMSREIRQAVSRLERRFIEKYGDAVLAIGKAAK